VLKDTVFVSAPGELKRGGREELIDEIREIDADFQRTDARLIARSAKSNMYFYESRLSKYQPTTIMIWEVSFLKSRGNPHLPPCPRRIPSDYSPRIP
jgi:hypothetical protein